MSLAIALLIVTASGLKAADGDSCQPISTAPAIITTSGAYCLTADILYTSASGSAIAVAAPHVTLDLSGHTITNLSAGTGTKAGGINGSSDDVTVRNGNVIGFYVGVSLVGSGALVENIRADQNRLMAIQLSGLGGVARNNLIIHTGNAAPYAGGNSNCITLNGDGTRALNNDMVDTVPEPSGSGTGISVFSGAGVVVEGNRVSNSALPSSGTLTQGIAFATTVSGSAVNNRIVKMAIGLLMGSSVAYRDNLTIGALDPYTGGNDAGNNQHF